VPPNSFPRRGSGYAKYPVSQTAATPRESRKLWQHSPLRRKRNLLTAAALTAILLVSGAGCKASIDAFGINPTHARHVADNAFAGIGYRFYNVRRDSAFARARTLMGKHALIPSRLFQDSTIWNVNSPDSSRTLIVVATLVDGHYTFAGNPKAPPPQSLGDQRHLLNLKWLGEGDYQWSTSVDHAIGPVTPAAAGAALMATLTAAEGRTPDEAMADARAMFPETARHLAQLFTVDSLRTVNDCCATTTMLSVTFHPERLRPRYSFFADYVAKYVVQAIYHVQLTDRAGLQYFDYVGKDGQMTIRLRSRGHQLVALSGHPVPMPDSLKLLMDVSMKYKMFRVGFRNLEGDFTVVRTPQRRAWEMRFRKEPAWQFPLAFDKLIKVPLRRPYQGEGARLALGIRNDGRAQSISERHARFAVSESAIMRWLGGLGASAFGDFSGRAELEENLFIYEMFEALRKDVNREW